MQPVFFTSLERDFEFKAENHDIVNTEIIELFDLLIKFWSSVLKNRYLFSHTIDDF